ncbi:hypothetical protein LINPERPRIM_LOCUS24262 [Linum perenne]
MGAHLSSPSSTTEEASSQPSSTSMPETRVLKLCLDANPDYYEPILMAEKNAEEQAMKEIREEDEQRKATAAAEGESEEVADWKATAFYTPPLLLCSRLAL